LTQAAGVSPDPPVLDAYLEPPDILDNLEALVVRDLLDFQAHLDLLDGPERLALRVLQDHQVDLVRKLFWQLKLSDLLKIQCCFYDRRIGYRCL